jgi:hypothetical protein
VSDRVAELVFGEGADRVCRDIPDAACDEQPRNLTVHLASLTSTKTGDGLLDPKLVLAWLVGALGGSAAAVGLLVPIREAFALLPQLFIGHRIRALEIRKTVWAWASAVQGLAVLGMAVVAFTLDGDVAAWSIVGLLFVFANARSFASVSYKDVLGKTVSKSKRGTVTGTAASASAIVVLAFGAALASGLIPLEVTSIAITLLVAGGLWVLAAALFSTLAEAPGATEGGVDAASSALGNLRTLIDDPQLGTFVVTRSLLTVTAIAPPYLLQLTSSGERSLGDLGPFVVASSIATIIGGRLWGGLADRSSRRVLMGSAGASALLFGISGIGTVIDERFLSNSWVAAGMLFLVMLAYQGVRLGRSTHLVDMADQDQRAVYTAVSNTVVGLVIVATGAFGALTNVIGLAGVLITFGVFSLVALVTATRLEEVQRADT